MTRGATASSGWHLLGNPYPAPLNWDNLRPRACGPSEPRFKSFGLVMGLALVLAARGSS